MVDNVFDDDEEIIDLTDLLEEGSPPEKTKRTEESRTTMHEPESFDLGREISMEDDVSVEEIDHLADGLDVEVSLTTGEEAALGEFDEPLEASRPNEGDRLSGDDAALDLDDSFRHVDSPEPAAVEEEIILEVEGQEPSWEEAESFSVDTEDIFARDETAEDRDLRVEDSSGPLAAPAEPTDTYEPAPAPSDEVHPKAQQPSEVAFEPRQEIDLEQLSGAVPELLEGIMRPLMQELVAQIVTTTRELLPGIVERVIQEEINKLKRLDIS